MSKSRKPAAGQSGTTPEPADGRQETAGTGFPVAEEVDDLNEDEEDDDEDEDEDDFVCRPSCGVRVFVNNERTLTIATEHCSRGCDDDLIAIPLHLVRMVAAAMLRKLDEFEADIAAEARIDIANG